MPELEKATESCGLMLVFKGGVQTQVNLNASKDDVKEKILDHIDNYKTGLIEFQTTEPNDNEIYMFDPREVLVVVLKKEFVIQSGNIQKVQVIPTVPPGGNAGPGRR